MDFKYKIADVAKEFGMPAKKVVETVSGVTGEAYKTAGTFEEKELNVLLETLTRENAEDSLDAYLASGKEPAPAPKAEKKPEPKKQPAAAQKPAAEPKPAEQPKPAAKKEPKPEQKKDSRKPEKQAESAARSASPCRSWPPTPALKSLSRPSRSRSTARRCPLTPAPST